MFENFQKDLDAVKALMEKKKSEIESNVSTLSPEQRDQFQKFKDLYATLPDKEDELKRSLNDLNIAKSKMK